ncbi:hypothetical protein FIBSPDRAFT_983428 [Athelia psychrophila]|uniref:Uncharacterized protein n=1 Tax=Athelia psychrophila TaxID=1759441 RepID=A0A166C019_9AGAM|nr:hypothetical protein FIBSPDRAFT_983428 [Fibularhizoctonia sp. CBS 109695]
MAAKAGGRDIRIYNRDGLLLYCIFRVFGTSGNVGFTSSADYSTHLVDHCRSSNDQHSPLPLPYGLPIRQPRSIRNSSARSSTPDLGSALQTTTVKRCQIGQGVGRYWTLSPDKRTKTDIERVARLPFAANQSHLFSELPTTVDALRRRHEFMTWHEAFSIQPQTPGSYPRAPNARFKRCTWSTVNAEHAKCQPPSDLRVKAGTVFLS